uniref:Catalase n=1 Tax=Nephromyces sp. MMRI TaxID=2496275 RepID=A0A3Q8UC62_9APIC|nr:catalase [Nephromyces sp. MMRI]AZL94527.1 catalase [Nephromyces sp. MMRI]AZL94528.1 catalase [Nephromyces sp. MMRI]
MEVGRPVITTSTGQPVDDNQNSITAGTYGPVLISDFHLIDKLAHFDRERIPERVVHAKGAAAHGVFEVTHDISKYCKAKLFESVGKKTPVFLRFSTVGGEKGSADTARDPRGFAIKFYTEEGNWDMVGNNTPVFFIRDPLKFPDFIHTQKRNPQTNLPDVDAFWDFLSLVPESNHQVTILFSDRGTPDGYRRMNGYSSHALKFVNSDNEVFLVQLHFKTNQGIKNLTAAEAGALASSDPDYATRDLFNHIEAGDYPSWTMYIQVMPEADAATYRFNPYDITKIWPHSDYPLIPVGTLTLNRNPQNYFAETEQSAFSPGHLVPGIQASEDKMLQGRLFSYPDTHRHRLGGNYDQIPVNYPRNAKMGDYNIRDGFMCVKPKPAAVPNYEPNSVFGTAVQDLNYQNTNPIKLNGYIARHPQLHPNDDYVQAGNLYRDVMTQQDRDHLISNIVGHLKNAKIEIQARQVKIFYRCDPDYGTRICDGVGLPRSVLDSSKL